MKVEVTNENTLTHTTPALVVGVFQNESLTQLDAALDKQISLILNTKEFTGEFGEMKLIHSFGKVGARQVLLVGLGEKKECTLEKLRRAAGKAAKRIAKEKIKSFSSALHAAALAETIADKVQAVVEGSVLSLYQFSKYKTVDKDKIHTIAGLTIVEPHENNMKDANTGAKKGLLLAKNVMFVRDLINEPAEKVTPDYLADEAKRISRAYKQVKLKVFKKSDILRMKMGGLEAVSRGGGHDPKLIILDYQGAKEDPIVFVGKGITFDSGGLNLKPYQYMEDMRCDMTGAATVMGTIKAAAELGLKKHIIAVIPTCENMLGPRAFKQGDIIKAYNGKTIEVWHTDAEGRLILADALSYTEKHLKPRAIVDIATLTGASIIALGHEITSLMATDENLKKDMLLASRLTGETMWELPLYDDYNELVKGKVGDIRNAAKDSPGPGTITAGLFLKNFVEKTPWVHLDVGATAWASSDKDYRPTGATGVCLRTFVKLLEG